MHFLDRLTPRAPQTERALREIVGESIKLLMLKADAGNILAAKGAAQEILDRAVPLIITLGESGASPVSPDTLDAVTVAVDRIEEITDLF